MRNGRGGGRDGRGWRADAEGDGRFHSGGVTVASPLGEVDEESVLREWGVDTVVNPARDPIALHQCSRRPNLVSESLCMVLGC